MKEIRQILRGCSRDGVEADRDGVEEALESSPHPVFRETHPVT